MRKLGMVLFMLWISACSGKDINKPSNEEKVIVDMKDAISSITNYQLDIEHQFIYTISNEIEESSFGFVDQDLEVVSYVDLDNQKEMFSAEANNLIDGEEAMYYSEGYIDFSLKQPTLEVLVLGEYGDEYVYDMSAFIVDETMNVFFDTLLENEEVNIEESEDIIVSGSFCSTAVDALLGYNKYHIVAPHTLSKQEKQAINIEFTMSVDKESSLLKTIEFDLTEYQEALFHSAGYPADVETSKVKFTYSRYNEIKEEELKSPLGFK